MEQCTLDSFTFVQDIQGLSLSSKFKISFDEEGLFTNIPLEECIDLAVGYISDGNSELKLGSTELKSFFSIATTQTHFLVQGSFYDQLDGVAMGSPLTPVLVNLSMGHHETYGWKIGKAQRYCCWQYILFILFAKQCATIVNYVNSTHPNIRFTGEKQTDHKILFLDVLINDDTYIPVTSVYQNFTGLLTNYLSFITYPYKLGLVCTFVDRAYKINNTWLGFHKGIKKLIEILKKNLFSAHLLERVVNWYLTLTHN